MYGDTLRSSYADELAAIESQGLTKRERLITSAQGASITVAGREVLNFCANNYLGLSNDPELRAAAARALDEFGFGLSSVRFICGTQTVHKTLEDRLSAFFGLDDTILYASCFDANGGLFETLLTDRDAVISDSLNHASIIDGIRLCKAKRYVYQHADLSVLEAKLREAKEAGARRILISTDGVFSMDGDVADISSICDLADRYGALVHVDDCHGTGFFGPTGRGSVEHCGAMGRVDIITSTLGKALGGAVGGFTSARKELVALLRQRSRPYLFSNSLPPSVVASGIACLDLVDRRPELRARLVENTNRFRSVMRDRGFTIGGEIHPIAPVHLGDAKLASLMAEKLLERGIYVIGFSFPVVPKGQARIRVQLSAAHTVEQVDRVIEAFTECGTSLGVL